MRELYYLALRAGGGGGVDKIKCIDFQVFVGYQCFEVCVFMIQGKKIVRVGEEKNLNRKIKIILNLDF